MAIIKSNQFKKKDKIKAEVSGEMLKQIQEYCEWSGIGDMGYFLEQAAQFVFIQDSDWKKRQKDKKNLNETTV